MSTELNPSPDGGENRSIPKIDNVVGGQQRHVFQDMVRRAGHLCQKPLAAFTRRKQREEELRHTHRALEMLTHCDEAVIRAEDEEHFLRQICQLAVDTGGYRMAWVGYCQADAERTIKPMAWFGEGSDYAANGKFSYAAHCDIGEGPGGRAVRTGQVVVCENFATDKTVAPWRELAASHGFGSLICLPLKQGAETFAVFSLYKGEAIRPTESETALLWKLAEDLAFGIAHLRTLETQKRLQRALRKLAAGGSAVAGSDFFEQLALNMTDAVGADAGLIGQLLPDKISSARALGVAVEGKIAKCAFFPVTPSDWGKTVGPCRPPKLDLSGAPAPSGALARMRESLGCRLENSSGEVMGFLWTGFFEPPTDMEFVTSTLQIFASRALSELQRQQTDQQLRAQASLLDKAQDAIMVRDLEGRITYWNKSAERLYGWKLEEVIGRPIQEVLYLDLEAFQERSRILMETGEWSGESEQIAKGGRVVTVEARMNLVRDERGTPNSILSINTDVTERKVLEAKFLRVQRMESIGNLAGGIAHDLNNVFAPILMAVDWLGEKVQDDQARAMLATLRASSQHGADLVRQVLSFARGVEGHRLPVNLVHLLRDLEKIIHDTFPKQITCSFNASPDLWMAVGDETQLHQVLMNLCVNARDAMPDGGSLAVSMENVVLTEPPPDGGHAGQVGNFVLIKIVDTGTGIVGSIQDKIFEPFFTTKPKGEGTGLGLSTSHAIVKGHGGLIVLDNKAKVGTTFRIYLPANPELREAQPIENGAVVPARGRGETILVVDDEESIRAVSHGILENAGYHVLTARDGNEAVALFREHLNIISLVLTDMSMPGMDGPATIAALKTLRPSLPIIGSSGLTSREEASTEAGTKLDYFISKPYSADELLRLLDRALVKT